MATLDNLFSQLNFPLDVIKNIYDCQDHRQNIIPMEEMNHVFEKTQFIKMYKSVINELNDLNFEKRQNKYMYDFIMKKISVISHKSAEKNLCAEWMSKNRWIPQNSRSYVDYLDDREYALNYNWITDDDELMDYYDLKDILKTK